MYILGINAYHADSSAAIFHEGKLIAATEEERFTRVKHWAGFPTLAIQFCLKEAGISIKDIGYITIGRDPKAKLLSKFKFMLKNPVLGFSIFQNRIQNRHQISNLSEAIYYVDESTEISEIDKKLHFIEHHRSHLASAFFASPYDEAAIISIDGSGDFTTTMIATGKGNKITVLDSVDFPCSIGLFYTAFTQFLGFNHYGDEYKVMGLAPYGKPVYVDKLKNIIQLTDDGLFKWNPKYFTLTRRGGLTYENNIPVVPQLYSDYFLKIFGPARSKAEELSQYYIDIAASVQKYTEEIILHIANKLQKKTGLKKLCIAGGVAQNSVANGKILSNTDFNELYVPSAGHDAGISMGSALFLYNQILNKPRVVPIYNAYTGAAFDSEEIKNFLDAKEVSFNFFTDVDLLEYVTNALLGGKVVGWFQGRAEFGPRALGHRSILVDPRRNDAKDLLNKKIKRRESFRPFAPSVLEEFAPEYFDGADKVPFMEKVYPIKEEKQKLIPAVTHIDGTGRLQTVMKGSRYYDLIYNFYKKTGIPILLNTSFNENEPIVNTPQEALDCFNRTEMDILVLENFVISR